MYVSVKQQDVDDIVNFGIPHGVDFIAASFVRKVRAIADHTIA
jgi:pyruvate kinase